MPKDSHDEEETTYKSSKLLGVIFIICFVGFIAALVLIDKYALK